MEIEVCDNDNSQLVVKIQRFSLSNIEVPDIADSNCQPERFRNFGRSPKANNNLI